MLALIASVELRENDTSYVFFDIDENTYKKNCDRVVTKIETLDGNVVVNDIGFAEGRKEIEMQTVISIDDHETLIDFQEDNINTFLFHYKRESYLIVLRSVQPQSFHGAKVQTTIKLDVIERLNEDGEYTYTAA